MSSTTNKTPFKNSNNPIRGPLFDESIDDDDDDDYKSEITSTIYNNHDLQHLHNLHSILKQPITESERIQTTDIINLMAKKLTILSFSLAYLPIIIGNMYYALTDKSCATLNHTMIILNLYDYLIVDSVTLFITLFAIIFSIIHEFKDNTFIKYIYDIYLICYKVFSFIWLIIGALIFWMIIDNHLCDNHLYYYLYITLIIKIICQGLYIMILFRQYNLSKN